MPEIPYSNLRFPRSPEIVSLFHYSALAYYSAMAYLALTFGDTVTLSLRDPSGRPLVTERNHTVFRLPRPAFRGARYYPRQCVPPWYRARFTLSRSSGV